MVCPIWDGGGSERVDITPARAPTSHTTTSVAGISNPKADLKRRETPLPGLSGVAPGGASPGASTGRRGVSVTLVISAETL
jgi:hypothetical protein